MSRRSIAGLVLASGMSRRYGSSNKLLVQLEGETVIARTVGAYLNSGLDRVVVVIGYQARKVSSALSALPVDIVLNRRYKEGQSRALVAGISALASSTDAVIIGVGDQPLLESHVISRIADTYRSTGKRLVAARYLGKRGNPALFDRTLFPELLTVEGDVGGRPVLERHRDEIEWIDFTDARLALDIDSQVDLKDIDPGWTNL
ncbi:MAG TPA: nucleotidyltransferase family protein [Chloroflexota bacterium]